MRRTPISPPGTIRAPAQRGQGVAAVPAPVGIPQRQPALDARLLAQPEQRDDHDQRHHHEMDFWDQRRAGGIADQGIGGAQIEEDGEQHPDEQDRASCRTCLSRAGPGRTPGRISAAAPRPRGSPQIDTGFEARVAQARLPGQPYSDCSSMTLARTSRAEISQPWSREGSPGSREDTSTSKITSPAPRSLSAKEIVSRCRSNG